MYVPRDRYSFTMSFWVVPRRAADGDALLLRVGDVEGQQPRSGGVDGHRRVHLPGRDLRRAGCACDRGAPPARPPCPPRRGPAHDRGRSRSAWAGRTRWTVRSAPSPGWCGRARSTPAPTSGRSTCASARVRHAASYREVLPLGSRRRHSRDPAAELHPPEVLWQSRLPRKVGSPSGGRNRERCGIGAGASWKCSAGPRRPRSHGRCQPSQVLVARRSPRLPVTPDARCTTARRAATPPVSRSHPTSATNATFDASVAVWNIDSPANSPPMRTPYSPPTSSPSSHVSTLWAQPRSCRRVYARTKSSLIQPCGRPGSPQRRIDRLERCVEADLEPRAALAQRPRDPQPVEREHTTGIGRPPSDAPATERHGEQSAAVGGQQCARLEVGADCDQPVLVGAVRRRQHPRRGRRFDGHDDQCVVSLGADDSRCRASVQTFVGRRDVRQ